jgi:hypothetical protein
MCSCELCQRRTGSPIHIGAWFLVEDVKIEGETKEFTRTSGDAGMPVTFNFCPNCGTSIWWGNVSEALTGRIGIAGGCFADSEFPPPTVAIYEKRRHPWIALPDGIPCSMEMPAMENVIDSGG